MHTVLIVRCKTVLILGADYGFGGVKMRVKAVLIERRPIEEIVDVKPDRVITSLRDLLGVLELC